MTTGTIRALLAVLLLPAAASAQSPRAFLFGIDEKISLLPDASHFFQHTDSDLVFEAQVAPDVRVIDNIAEGLRRVLNEDRPRVFVYSVYGTPMFRLRMFDEESSPVRTPSYMPKVSLQFAWLRNVSKATDPLERQDGPIEMWLLHTIPFGHHSNGQNGCLFTDQVRVEGECGPTIAAGPRAVNRENGSFSTNYIRVGGHYRRLYQSGEDPDIEDPVVVTEREWGVGVSLEVHPEGYVGGSIDEELKPLYGATRLQTSADLAARNWTLPFARRVVCGRAWAGLSLEYIDGAPRSVPDVTTVAEAACLPKSWGGTGIFVRYYRGQDYYNLGFLTKISRLQFGVTFHQAKFLAFPIPST